jgi:hypothetical protein
MKFVLYVVLGLLLLWASPAMQAGPPASASQTVIGVTGGSTWTSGNTGTCIWYFPVVGDLDLGSLFASDLSKDLTGAPVIDKEHSYLIWVSDWSIQAGFANSALSLAVVPAGTATVYFSSNPLSRDWSNLANRSTWGVPVAHFVRGGGLFRSADGWQSDTFTFSAPLVSSKTFTLVNGKRFNFRELMLNGMTCFESGWVGSSMEAGTCVAMGLF